MARESVPSADLDPDLAATLRGTPAERAAAMDRYVAKHYPRATAARGGDVMNVVKPLIIPAIIVLLAAILFAWIKLT
jgi:hypothetical protein